jgi:hypothetical protein
MAIMVVEAVTAALPGWRERLPSANPAVPLRAKFGHQPAKSAATGWMSGARSTSPPRTDGADRDQAWCPEKGGYCQPRRPLP